VFSATKEPMMRKTLLRNFTLLFLAGTAGVNAQPAAEQEFGIHAVSGAGGILLFLGPDMLHPSTASETGGWVGYVIYRKAEGEETFARITPVPVTRVNSLGEMEALIGPGAEKLEQFVGVKDSTALWQKFLQKDPRLETLSMMSPELREAMGLVYRDRHVHPNVPYTYNVTRITTDGRESDPSLPSTAVYGVPPFVMKGPLGVEGAADEKSVMLRWWPDPTDTAALGYVVYRSLHRDGPFVNLTPNPILVFANPESNTLPEITYVDSTVSPGRPYFYTVVSRDFAGNESPKDRVVSFVPRDTIPPARPTGLSGESGAAGVRLRWDNPADTTLGGINIYRSPSADSTYMKLNRLLVPVTPASYVDRDVVPNRQYFYRISAVDRSGNESDTTVAVFASWVNKGFLLPPQNVRAEPQDGGVRISWAQRDEVDLFGYYVYRSNSRNGDLVQISPRIPPDTTWYIDDDEYLSPKGQYWYVVRSTNYSESMSGYSRAVVGSPDATALPRAPSSFYAQQDETGIRLFWTLPEDNTVRGYQLLRREGIKGWAELAKVDRVVRSFTDSSASPGTGYAYRLRSVNADSVEGAPTQEVKIIRIARAPLRPAFVRVTKTSGGLRVAWDPVRLPGVQGYAVYRRMGTGKRMKVGETTGEQSSVFTDSTATVSGRYFYSVVTIGSGGKESQPTEEATVRIP
jgi:fibronectin type 3 domain-containing protein